MWRLLLFIPRSLAFIMRSKFAHSSFIIRRSYLNTTQTTEGAHSIHGMTCEIRKMIKTGLRTSISHRNNKRHPKFMIYLKDISRRASFVIYTLFNHLTKTIYRSFEMTGFSYRKDSLKLIRFTTVTLSIDSNRGYYNKFLPLRLSKHKGDRGHNSNH